MHIAKRNEKERILQKRISIKNSCFITNIVTYGIILKVLIFLNSFLFNIFFNYFKFFFLSSITDSSFKRLGFIFEIFTFLIFLHFVN